MSITHLPYVTPSPTVAGFDSGASNDATLTRLRQLVAGTASGESRSSAMAALLRSDFPNKHRDFEAVLGNDQEGPEWRYVAAICLGTIGTPTAMAILVHHLDIREERVLAGVMKALGRIGDRTAFDAIAEVRSRATGSAARQADFAATLIAHRIGNIDSAGGEAATVSLLDVDARCARPLRIQPADAGDAERCLCALASQPFGIEFAERPMYQLRCGNNCSMVLLNRDWVTPASTGSLMRRPAFLGVVAARRSEDPGYVITHLVLTSPADDALSVRIYRPGGALALAGTARMTGDRAAFSIGAVSRPGAFAVSLEGTFAAGILDIATAVSTPFAQVPKREPVEER